MLFVKILKILSLIFFSFMFVIISVLLQLNSTVKHTVFSDKYFNSVYDRNIKPQVFDKILQDIIENSDQYAPLDDESKKALKGGKLSPDVKKLIESFKETLRETIDLEWLKTDVTKIVKGTYTYFTGDSESLPTINVKPLKNSILNIYSNQIISNSGSKSLKDSKKIIQQIDKVPGGIMKDGKLNEKAVDKLMKLDIFKSLNFSRDTIGRFAEKIGNRKKEGTSDKELTEFLIKEMLKDKMGMNQMKEELDLNVLFNTMYGDTENPVISARGMINGIRNKLFTINTIIFIILLLLIIILAFYPSSILRCSGIGLAISGGICLLPAILSGFSAKTIADKFGELQVKGMDFELLFLQKWMQSFLNGIIKYMLIQGIIIVAFGIVFIVLSFFVPTPNHIKNLLNDEFSDGKKSFLKKSAILTLSRIIVIFLLFSTMFFSIFSFSKSIGLEIEKFNEIKISSDEQKEKINVNEALDKVLNSKFFESISGGV